MKKSRKYELTPADHRAGGHAHAAKVRKQKDKQVASVARRFAALSNLEDLKFRPALQALARITLLAERAYLVLKERESLLDEHGELCKSIDAYRRLVDSQANLLDMIGLTPRADREMRSWKERDLDLIGELAKSVGSNTNGDAKSE